PTLVGALLAALGLIVALRSFALDGAAVPRFDARPIGVSIFAIVLLGIALQWVGLVDAVAVHVHFGACAARHGAPTATLLLAWGPAPARWRPSRCCCTSPSDSAPRRP